MIDGKRAPYSYPVRARCCLRAARQLVLICAIALGVPLEASANDDIRTELSSLQRSIEAQSEKLSTVATREAQQRERQRELEVHIKTIREEKAELDKELVVLEADAAKLSTDVKRIEAEISERARFSDARMRAVYMNGGFTTAQLVAESRSLSELEVVGFYLSKVKAADMRRLQSLEQLKRQSEEHATALARTTAERGATRAAILRKEGDLQRGYERSKQGLRLLAQEKLALERAIQELRAKALRLETIVNSIAAGVSLDATLPVKVGEKRSSPPPSVAPFDGRGLFRMKGSLRRPVEGKVLRGFGKYHPGQARELVLHKGVEYSAAAGSHVRAIGGGKVMFVGKMPAYGGLVIVDHGERYYSLYGHTREVTVKVGEVVDTNQLIAVTDDTGKFYFEIRKNGTPVNPVHYLGKAL